MVKLEYNEYTISSYRYGYVVKKLTTDENGDFVESTDNKHSGYKVADTVGYYNNLQQALSGLTHYIIRLGKKDISTLTEYREQLKQIEQDLENKLDGLVEA